MAAVISPVPGAKVLTQAQLVATMSVPVLGPVPSAIATLAVLAQFLTGLAPSGTYTSLTGGGAVTVADTRVTANSVIIFTLKTLGGTPTAAPYVATITPGTGFTVKGSASGDTSVYNYLILN